MLNVINDIKYSARIKSLAVKKVTKTIAWYAERLYFSIQIFATCKTEPFLYVILSGHNEKSHRKN